MTDRELMQQALEALKMCRTLIRINIERLVPIESPNPWFFRDIDHTIAALRERLAQPEKSYPDNFIHALMYDVARRDSEAQQAYEDAFINGTGVMLGDKRIDAAIIYKQPAQQQEPVAWMLEWTFNGEERGRRLYDDETHCVFDAENDGGVCRPLYTSPPASKPWVGLTDEEKADLFEGTAPYYNETDYADAIEAKLREKNA